MVIPNKPFAFIFDLFLFLTDNLNWISCKIPWENSVSVWFLTFHHLHRSVFLAVFIFLPLRTFLTAGLCWRRWESPRSRLRHSRYGLGVQSMHRQFWFWWKVSEWWSGRFSDVRLRRQGQISNWKLDQIKMWKAAGQKVVRNSHYITNIYMLNVLLCVRYWAYRFNFSYQ